MPCYPLELPIAYVWAAAFNLNRYSFRLNRFAATEPSQHVPIVRKQTLLASIMLRLGPPGEIQSTVL